MVDVKLTETNLPWYFRVAHEVLTGVPFINAHARVEILQESIVHGAEPLAIAESAPVAVKAFYVDEDKANEVLASAPLTNTGPNGYFSNSTATCTFTIAAKVDYGSANTKGMSVTPVIGGKKGSPLTFNSTTGLWTGTATHTSSGSNEVSLVVKCAKETASP